MVDLNVCLVVQQAKHLFWVSFYSVIVRDWFLLYIHIIENLLCAQTLA